MAKKRKQIGKNDKNLDTKHIWSNKLTESRISKHRKFKCGGRRIGKKSVYLIVSFTLMVHISEEESLKATTPWSWV